MIKKGILMIFLFKFGLNIEVYLDGFLVGLGLEEIDILGNGIKDLVYI